ncbi:TonB-dependent receptor domain-containing protein [Rhodanobacter aciditrophus]|uniref:TonB-dependent receptor domain-containing protein n=1 Tax=Rhodanobacter aciditrophus TaxID=1623218 RepID=A0ABW4AVF8_9GAMM
MSRTHFPFTLVAASLLFAHSAQADTVNLEELVVSASGYEQNTEDAAASITVISADELEKKNYRDVTDALASVPGVYVSGGGSTSDITMRGLGGKYTLILVDGKRQGSRETRPNSDGPGIEQGWLPPVTAIERIEVVRGPMSSLYGSDALGGVINIITKKVQPEWHGEVSVGTVIQEDSDSGDSRQADFYVAGPVVENKLGLEVYGQISQRDEDNIEDGYAEQSIKNLTSKATWQINDQQSLKFEAGTEKQDRDRTTGNSSDSDSTNDYQRDHFSVTNELNTNSGQHTTYLSYEENDNKTREMVYESTVLNHQSHLFFDRHTLTVGGQFENQKLTDTGNQLSSDVDQLERWQAAVFAEDEFYLTDDFALTTGLRVNEDENYGTAVTPRIYGVWHTTDTISLKGGISAGYRSPDLRQATDGWGQITGRGSGMILGNSDLEAEKSISHEVGIAWNNRQGTKAELTAFYTQFKDKITEERICDVDAGDASCDGGYDFISTRYNVDDVVTQGIEASFGTMLTDNLSWDIGYTLTDSEQKSGEFKGEPLNRIPKHRVHTNLSWDATDKLNVWGELNYVGETSDGLSRTSMAEGYPDYTLIDTGLAYQATESVTLYAGIYNLLDKEIDSDTYGSIQDGRRYHAKIKVAF